MTGFKNPTGWQGPTSPQKCHDFQGNFQAHGKVLGFFFVFFVGILGCTFFSFYADIGILYPDSWGRKSFGGHPAIQEFSNIPLEHTPDPQPTVYEGIPFIWGVGDAWGMLQVYVGVLLEANFQSDVFSSRSTVKQPQKPPWRNLNDWKELRWKVGCSIRESNTTLLNRDDLCKKTYPS